jgi:hypothetical protein
MELETIPISYGDNADNQKQHNGVRRCTQAYWHPIEARSLQFVFYDAFSVTQDYVASNERVLSERWIGKNVEESGSGLI